MSEMKIKTAKIEDLNPAPYNPRVHPEKAISRLKASIERFGYTNPVLVQKGTNTIIAGHARVEAAKQAGLDEVPVIYLDFDDVTAKAYNIADNRLAELTEWDFPKLKDLITEIDTGAFDIELTGFSEAELKGIIDYDPYPASDKDDAVPEVAEGEPITKTGDLYQLGRHRLLCGDSTKREDVERLMDGEKADMVFTDPPYNVDYGVSKNPRHKIRTIENDKQTPDEWEAFCKDIFLNFKEFNGGDIYMWGASGPEGMKMRLWLTEMGCHWSATIVWKKQQLVLSPANYQRMYEPCFYGWFGKSSYCGDRKQTEVWEVDRPHNSPLHPTQKPIKLGEIAMQNSSQRGGLVLDLFGGSGSTLIAAEKTQRVAYVCEIDPHYCDVIVKRWEDYTGQKAVRL